MKDPKSFFDPPRDVVVSTIFVDKIYLLPSPCSSRDVSIFLGEGLLRLMLNTLNSSKTEFLLIIFSKKHAKINNSSLNTTHSAQNLDFIFDEHLAFSDKIANVSKSCYCHIRQLCYIRPYIDPKTASTIATSTVHSKLDYCNSLYHNLPSLRSPDSNRSRTILHVLLSKLPNPVTSLPSFGLCTG